MANILLAEDDATLQEAYRLILEINGHRVFSAFNGKEALVLVKKQPFDIILLDLHMPIMGGLEFLQRHKNPPTKVIIFSNMIDPEVEKQAVGLGAYMCVLKSSMTPSSMLSFIEEATP